MKRILTALALLVFITIGVNSLNKHSQLVKLKNIQLKSTQANLNDLNIKYDKLTTQQQKLLQDKNATQDQLDQVQQQKADLEKQKADLEAQLQARADEKARLANIAQSAVVYAATAPQNGCGDNSYANYIYTHESGCSTTAVNSIGCLGIGQACPGSKLTSVCPDLDYACENQFFTSYAVSRYGSWEGAYQAWLVQHWW